MILGLIKLMASVWAFIASGLAAALTWVRENPKLAGVLLVITLTGILSAWYSYHWAESKTTAKYAIVIQAQGVKITKYESDLVERDSKIKEVEASSKLAAEEAITQLAKKDVVLAKAKANFNTALKKEKALREASLGAVTVVSPQTQNQVVVTLDNDEVVCGRFHDSFLESVNTMVTGVNDPNFVKVTAPTVTQSLTPVLVKTPSVVQTTQSAENTLSTPIDATVANRNSSPLVEPPKPVVITIDLPAIKALLLPSASDSAEAVNSPDAKPSLPYLPPIPDKALYLRSTIEDSF